MVSEKLMIVGIAFCIVAMLAMLASMLVYAATLPGIGVPILIIALFGFVAGLYKIGSVTNRVIRPDLD